MGPRVTPLHAGRTCTYSIFARKKRADRPLSARPTKRKTAAFLVSRSDVFFLGVSDDSRDKTAYSSFFLPFNFYRNN